MIVDHDITPVCVTSGFDAKLRGREGETADRLFIDQTLIPAEICSRSGIKHLNEMLARLAARKTDQIVLPEPDSGFGVSNQIRAYCQAFVRRSLCLFESAYGLFFTENGLVSLMCVRAIYEGLRGLFCWDKVLTASPGLARPDTGAISREMEPAVRLSHARPTTRRSDPR